MLPQSTADAGTRHALDLAAKHGFQVTRLTIDGNTHQPGSPGFDPRLVLHTETRSEDQWGVRDAVHGGSFFNVTTGQWDPERVARCSETPEEHQAYFATLAETLQRAQAALCQRLESVRGHSSCPRCEATTTATTGTGPAAPAEAAITAARTFVDAMERAGLHEVAADAAVSSVDVQVGLIQALDGVRDCIGETFTELAGALDRDIDADALNDAAAHLSTAGEDVLGLLDVLDPERDAAHRH